MEKQEIRKYVLLQQLTAIQMVKEFHAFYGTLRFITMLTRARHWTNLLFNGYQRLFPWGQSGRGVKPLTSI
jgi:hypothetical protein